VTRAVRCLDGASHERKPSPRRLRAYGPSRNVAAGLAGPAGELPYTTGVERPYVVVVSGAPRSGTSLAMQMLRAGGLPVLADDRRPPDASNLRGYWELAAVRRLPRDAGWLEGAEGHAVKVVHALLPALPAGRFYRVVWMERDAAEVARSQRALLARAGRAPDDGLDDARAAAVQAAQLDAVARAVEARPEFRRQVVRYADLLRDPAAGAARMAAFLDGALDVAAMARAVDPALHRVRSAPS